MADGEKRGGPAIALAILAPVLVAGIFIGIIIFVLSPAAACGAGTGTRVNLDAMPTEPVAGYGDDQLMNAALIMNAAIEMGLDRDAQVLGVMTAMGESSLVNIDYGDWETNGVRNPDGSPTTSIGLFQQQESWGTPQQRMDPTTAATLFYERLVKVEGWADMEPTLAIHKVQVNADPWHYEKYNTAAEQIVTALSGAVGTCASGELVYPLADGYNVTSDYGPRNINIPGASNWHAATDMQHWPNNCNDPIYAIQEGRVTFTGTFQVTIKHPDGYDISYLHMWPEDVIVSVGDDVTAGQQIGVTGNSGPSGGCHLDLRINVAGNTNAQLDTLVLSQAEGAPGVYANFVNPEAFYALYGMELCGGAGACNRPPIDGTELPIR